MNHGYWANFCYELILLIYFIVICVLDDKRERIEILSQKENWKSLLQSHIQIPSFQQALHSVFKHITAGTKKGAF